MLKKYRVLIFTIIVVLFFAFVFFAGYFGAKPESKPSANGGCCGMETNAESGDTCKCSPSESEKMGQTGAPKGTVDNASPK